MNLNGVRKGPTCAAYTSFLIDACADYGRGLAALLPCMWGYSTLGQLLAKDPPKILCTPRGCNVCRPRIRRPGSRCAQMLDEAHRDALVDERRRPPRSTSRCATSCVLGCGRDLTDQPRVPGHATSTEHE